MTQVSAPGAGPVLVETACLGTLRTNSGPGWPANQRRLPGSSQRRGLGPGVGPPLRPPPGVYAYAGYGRCKEGNLRGRVLMSRVSDSPASRR